MNSKLIKVVSEVDMKLEDHQRTFARIASSYDNFFCSFVLFSFPKQKNKTRDKAYARVLALHSW